MVEGYNERKQREWDQKQVELYLVRHQAVTLHNIAAGLAGDKGIKASDLYPLPLFDSKDQKVEPLDKEYFKEIVKRDGKQWHHK